MRRVAACVAAVTWVCVAQGCSADAPSLIAPQGPAAERIAGLWWLMLAISGVVLVALCAMLGVGLVRGRHRTESAARGPARWGEPFIVVAGIVVSGLLLVAVFLISIRDLQAVAGGSKPSLTIEVVGHDWWWEVRYPNGAVTANEIHIPAGRRVRLKLTTEDVIHSFWVPQLGPKTDMVPGRVNEARLQAHRPGRYRGQCAEFCGLQHANMILWVVADEPGEFDDWLRNEARPARRPPGSLERRGERVFLTSTCAGCHSIRGTEADARVGPDLTHLAGRETIAAGMLARTTSNLSTWIADPQEVKPGAVMPPTELSARDMAALVAYLQGLD